mmetsp:Transcript_4183/g.9071  ORF Transcript_4183/g.9071 Transcript_4183/m.9071 type:complete len:264 (+) Transcript_4183:1526-2317(+)
MHHPLRVPHPAAARRARGWPPTAVPRAVSLHVRHGMVTWHRAPELTVAGRLHQCKLPHVANHRVPSAHPAAEVLLLLRPGTMRMLRAHRLITTRFSAARDASIVGNTVATCVRTAAAAVAAAAATTRLFLSRHLGSRRPHLKSASRFVRHEVAIGAGTRVRLTRNQLVGVRYSLSAELAAPSIVMHSGRESVPATTTRHGRRQRNMLPKLHLHLHVVCRSVAVRVRMRVRLELLMVLKLWRRLLRMLHVLRMLLRMPYLLLLQ